MARANELGTSALARSRLQLRPPISSRRHGPTAADISWCEPNYFLPWLLSSVEKVAQAEHPLSESRIDRICRLPFAPNAKLTWTLRTDGPDHSGSFNRKRSIIKKASHAAWPSLSKVWPMPQQTCLWPSMTRYLQHRWLLSPFWWRPDQYGSQPCWGNPNFAFDLKNDINEKGNPPASDWLHQPKKYVANK